MNPLASRRLSPDDWALWRELRLQALAESPHAFGSTLADWQGRADAEQRWRARLRDVPFNVVVQRGGTWAGMASGTTCQTNTVELLSMWVAPWARGAGAGDHLVREVAEWARAQSARQLVLRVYVGNAAALSLYRRNGFEQTSVIKARSAGRADEVELALAL
ncbi:MAG: GNAT family N-acetyltransferase [Myxococcales bacterium]